MTPAALVEQARRAARECLLDVAEPPRCDLAWSLMGGINSHIDHHLAIAIRADREAVAREAFRAGRAFGAHGGNPTYQEPPDVEATVKRLAEGGAE